MEKRLGIQKLTPKMFSTIITSYNRAQTRNQRIQILSLLVPDFSYKVIFICFTLFSKYLIFNLQSCNRSFVDLTKVTN